MRPGRWALAGHSELGATQPFTEAEEVGGGSCLYILAFRTYP